MVDNVADDDVELKPAKNEGSGEGSGDVKQTVNLKPFKVQIPMQTRIDKIVEPKPVPIGVICKARNTASFFTPIIARITYFVNNYSTTYFISFLSYLFFIIFL